MKKAVILSLIIGSCLAACSPSGEERQKETSSSGNSTEISNTEVSSSSSDVTQESTDDVITSTMTEITNYPRMEKFYQNFEAGIADSIEIQRSTVEGDPIYHFVSYDGEGIELVIDSTEDRFGSQEVTEQRFDEIVKTDWGYELQDHNGGKKVSLLRFEDKAE